jgi:hypothetical protein
LPSISAAPHYKLSITGFSTVVFIYFTVLQAYKDCQVFLFLLSIAFVVCLLRSFYFADYKTIHEHASRWFSICAIAVRVVVVHRRILLDMHQCSNKRQRMKQKKWNTTKKKQETNNVTRRDQRATNATRKERQEKLASFIETTFKINTA